MLSLNDKLKEFDEQFKLYHGYGQGTDWVIYKYKDDDEFIIALVKRGYYAAMQHASYRLLDNKEEMFKLAKDNHYILKYAGSKVRSDKEGMFEIAVKHPDVLEYASASVRDDEVGMLNVAKKDKREVMLRASERLRDSEEFVLKVLSLPGSDFEVLRFVSGRLRDNEQIVFEAVKNYIDNLQFASERLLSDRNFILKLIRIFGESVLKYANEKLKTYDEVFKSLSSEMLKEHHEEAKKSKQDARAVELDVAISSIEENIKIKTEQINELTQQLQKLQAERQQLYTEVNSNDSENFTR